MKKIAFFSLENLLEKFNSEQKEPLFSSSYNAPIIIDKYDGNPMKNEMSSSTDPINRMV